MRALLFITIFSVATFFYTETVSAQEKGKYQPFEGTRVSMVLPEGFEKMPQQPVYFHQGSGSTVQITEVPDIAAVYTIQAITKEALEQNEGVTFVSSEDVQMASGLDAKLVVVAFNVEGMDYERIMFITGDYNYSVIINVNYPKMTKKLLFDVLKKSLITAKF